MKKFLVFALFLVLMCGCQKEEGEAFNREAFIRNDGTATPTPTKEPTPTERPWYTIVTVTPRPTATNTPTPTPTMIPYEVADEILSADEFSGKVQIADTVLQLPCRLNEILEISNITVEQSPYSSLSGYDPLNNTYQADSENDLLVTFGDGSRGWLTVVNKERLDLPLEELYVTELISESPCIFFPKGVSVGAHCSVLKEWREHTSMVPGSYTACYKYKEAEYQNDYGKLDLGAAFEIDVNNTTYNIDEIKYTPAFYVSMEHMTELLERFYPENLVFHVPVALVKSWKTGLIVYEGRQFVVELEETWMYDAPKTTESLLETLGRELRYYNEEWDSWHYYTDTSDAANEKIVAKEEERLVSLVNFWDYSDFAGADTLTLDDKLVRPEYEKWKKFANVAVSLDGYLNSWKFILTPMDQGDIPAEVNELFREVVLEMAESVKAGEE